MILHTNHIIANLKSSSTPTPNLALDLHIIKVVRRKPLRSYLFILKKPYVELWCGGQPLCGQITNNSNKINRGERTCLTPPWRITVYKAVISILVF